MSHRVTLFLYEGHYPTLRIMSPEPTRHSITQAIIICLNNEQSASSGVLAITAGLLALCMPA